MSFVFAECLFQDVLHPLCFVIDVFAELACYFRVVVSQRLVLFAVGSVVTKAGNELWRPSETFSPHFLEQEISRPSIDEIVIFYVDEYGCADDALVDDDAPVVVCLPLHFGLRQHVELLADLLDKCSVCINIEQGVDKRVIELMNERGRIPEGAASRRTESVAADGEDLARLS